jgi:hypothetical protein
VSLDWMVREAQSCGLRLRPQALQDVRREANMHADIADSRAGLAAYYRYDPRRLADLCNDEYNQVRIARPKIHHSVLERIRAQHVEYVPHVLPGCYDVVDAAGDVLDSNPYETPGQAAARMTALERAWDLVWWRRIAYFVTLGLTLLLAAFPWLPWVKQAGGCTGPWCFVEPLLEALGGILPTWAETWSDAYRRNVGLFLLLAAGLAASMVFGKRMERRILVRSSAAWSHLTGRKARAVRIGPLSAIARGLRTSRAVTALYLFIAREGLPFFWAAATFVVVLLGTNRLLFDIAEAAGLVCKASPGTATLVAQSEAVRNDFRTSDLCFATGVVLEEEQIYVLRLTVVSDWLDRNEAASPQGFGAKGAPLVYAIGIPGRRSWTSPWFTPVARVGVFGRERHHPKFSPAPGKNNVYVSEPFMAHSTGELFLFVNDAVLALPYLADVLYRNNHGTARVTVERVEDLRYLKE